MKTRVVSILTLFIFGIFSSTGFSQDLQLENSGKQKIISIGSFVKVVICQGKVFEEESCKLLTYIGKLEGLGSDELLIVPIYKEINEKNDEMTIYQEFEYSETNTNISTEAIPIADIYYISNLGKSRKARKKLANKNVTGGLLIFSGLITGISSLLVKEKKDRNKLLLAAGSEFGLGIVLISLGYKKKYFLQNINGEEKIWRVTR